MKLHQLTTMTCAAVLFCGTALAQNTSNLIDASKLDGKKVVNLQGEELGDVQQLLIDPQTGRVRYVVLEVNKLWKLDDPEVAVPFGALTITGKPADANFKMTLDATKEKLSKAPKHKVGEADRLFSKEASAPLYTYWSIYWFEDPTPASTAPKASGDKATTTDKSSTAPATTDPAKPATPKDSTK